MSADIGSASVGIVGSSTSKARSSLDAIDQAGYTGSFQVHTDGTVNLHPSTLEQVTAALSLADNWAWFMTLPRGAHAFDGGPMVSHRRQWTLFVEADQLDGLPAELVAAVEAGGQDQ